MTTVLLSVCMFLAVMVSAMLIGMNTQIAYAKGSTYDVTFTEPADSGIPATEVTISSSSVKNASISWYAKNESDGTWRQLQQGEAFSEGNIYKAVVTLTSADGKAFDVSSNDDVTFNDKKATVTTLQEDKIVAERIYSCKNVAKIGDTTYTTLDDALIAASDGDEIELLDDITWEGRDKVLAGNKRIVIPSGKTLTLASTGYATYCKLTIRDTSQVLIKEGGNLVLAQDTSTDGYAATVKLEGTAGATSLSICGTFTVNSGTYVDSATSDFTDILLGSSGKIVIKSGAIYRMTYSGYTIPYISNDNGFIKLGEDSELSEEIVDGKLEYTLTGTALIRNATQGSISLPCEISSNIAIKIPNQSKLTVNNMTLEGAITVERGGELAIADGGTLNLNSDDVVIADGAYMTKGTGTLNVNTDWEISSGTFDFNPANDDEDMYVKENYNIYKYSTAKYVVSASEPEVAEGFDFWKQNSDDSVLYELAVCTHTDLQHIEGKAATLTEEGNIEYWQCNICKRYYSDANTTTEIEKEDTVIAKLSDEKKTEDETGNKTDDKTDDKTDNKADPESVKEGLSTGAIVGIVIGCIVLVLLILYMLGYVFLYRKHKLDEKKIKVIYSFLPQDEVK